MMKQAHDTYCYRIPLNNTEPYHYCTRLGTHRPSTLPPLTTPTTHIRCNRATESCTAKNEVNEALTIVVGTTMHGRTSTLTKAAPAQPSRSSMLPQNSRTLPPPKALIFHLSVDSR